MCKELVCERDGISYAFRDGWERHVESKNATLVHLSTSVACAFGGKSVHGPLCNVTDANEWSIDFAQSQTRQG